MEITTTLIRRHSPSKDGRLRRPTAPPSPARAGEGVLWGRRNHPHARRLLLSRTLARKPVGRRRAAHARDGHRLCAHWRIRVEPDRAGGGAPGARMAASRPGYAGRGGPESRVGNADRDAAEMADGPPSGNRSGRSRRTAARLRLAPPLHLFFRYLTAREGAHRRKPPP